MPYSIAITGATDFVGSALFQTLRANPKYTVKGFCRTLPKDGATEGLLALGNLESADFAEALAGVGALNSLAIEQRERTSFKEKFARKHIMQRMAQDILQQG